VRQHRGTRIALGSAVLVGLIGTGTILGVGMARHTGAHPLATTHTAAASMAGSGSAMAHMVDSHLPATMSTQGTVVRLHQRVVRLTIHNFAFQPARLVVSPGTRLVWTNTDSDPHTVDSTKGVWSSEALDTGSQFARVFSQAGTFPYYCSIHPFMHGTIVVQK
jgi:plastocyanin